LEEEGEKRKGEKENGEKLIIFIYVSDNVSFAVRHTTLWDKLRNNPGKIVWNQIVAFLKGQNKQSISFCLKMNK
jgi:hypothetical protein